MYPMRVPGTGKELKFLDQNYRQTATANILTLATSKDHQANPTTAVAAKVHLLNAIAEGSDANQRIGRQVTWKSILIRMHLAQNAAFSIANGGIIRMFLIYDAANNGSSTDIARTDLLSTITTNEWVITAPNLLDNRGRFRVIMDKIFTLDGLGGKGSMLNFKKFRRLNLPSLYKDNNAALSSIMVGSLWLMFLTTIQTDLPTGALSVRLRFADD